MTAYNGQVYQAQSGQWSWRISDNQAEICGGAGYLSEDEAQQAMAEELNQLSGGDYAI